MKYSPFAAISFMLILNACNRQIDVINEPDRAIKAIEGEWQMQEDYYYGIEVNSTITFRGDGSYTLRRLRIDPTTKSYESNEFNGRWEIEGSYLWQVDDSWPVKSKIVNLSDRIIELYPLDHSRDTIAAYEIHPENVLEFKKAQKGYRIEPPSGFKPFPRRMPSLEINSIINANLTILRSAAHMYFANENKESVLISELIKSKYMSSMKTPMKIYDGEGYPLYINRSDTEIVVNLRGGQEITKKVSF